MKTCSALSLLVTIGLLTKDDTLQKVADLVGALRGTESPGYASWKVEESWGGTIGVDAGSHGWAKVRQDYRKVMVWRAEKLDPGAKFSPRPEPESYVSEDLACQLAMATLKRMGRSGLEIGEVRVTQDRVSPLGDFEPGWATVWLQWAGDLPFFGPHRRGITLSFDSADGTPVLFSERDRVVTIAGSDRISETEAKRIADDYLGEQMPEVLQMSSSTTIGYCASLAELGAIGESGNLPMYSGPLNTYRCVCVAYGDPQQYYVCIRLSDGEVLWSGISD